MIKAQLEVYYCWGIVLVKIVLLTFYEGCSYAEVVTESYNTSHRHTFTQTNDIYIYIYTIFSLFPAPGGAAISKRGAANIFIRSISDDGHVSYNTGFNSANI